MVSRENLVTLVFVAAALPIAYAVHLLADQFVVSFAVVVAVGVVVPTLINEYLDRRDTE